MSFNLSTTLYLYDCKEDVFVTIDNIANAGFAYIDFNFADWIFVKDCPIHQDNWKEWLISIKKYADNLGVSFNQGHAPMYNFLDTTNERINFFELMTERSIIGSGILGIKNLVFHCSHLPQNIKDDENLSKTIALNKTWFEKKIPICTENNVRIAIENLVSPTGITSCPKRHIDFINSFNSEYVGACFDTGHANIVGTDKTYAIKLLGEKLYALHVHDNFGQSDQHMIPFIGNINWQEIIYALRDISYKGEFTYETQIRFAPDECKKTAIKLLYEIGQNIINSK